MLTRFRTNVVRWPRVFTVLVLFTVLELGIDFGLCRYIGHLSLNDTLFTVTTVILATAFVAGIAYWLIAPVCLFSFASVLDRVEGRYIPAESEEYDSESEEYGDEEES